MRDDRDSAKSRHVSALLLAAAVAVVTSASADDDLAARYRDVGQRVMARALVGQALARPAGAWRWREGASGRPEIDEPGTPLGHIKLCALSKRIMDLFAMIGSAGNTPGGHTVFCTDNMANGWVPVCKHVMGVK